MVDMLTRNEIRQLAQAEEFPCISIQMPIEYHADGEQNPIRIRKLLRQARTELEALGLKQKEIDGLLGSFARLQEVNFAHEGGGNGLAVFAAPGFYREIKTPFRLPELAVVAQKFHIKNLLALLQADATFYVLALSANRVRLLQCTRAEAGPVPLPDVPSNARSVLAIKEEDRSLQLHTSSTVGHFNVTFHGSGVTTQEQKKEDLLEFFQAVDKALWPVLREERAPLVLAAVDYYHSLFRQVNTYPELTETGITGNCDHMDDRQLREKAWPVVEPLVRAARESDEARFHYRNSKGMGSIKLRQAVEASCFGRIEVLFAPSDVERWGTCQRDTGKVEIHDQRRPGDVDLINEAAINTILHGGTLYLVPRDQLPDGSHGKIVNATLRW